MLFNIVLLLIVVNTILASNNWNSKHQIRNITFKTIIFKEKKVPKVVNYVKKYYNIYKEKTLVTISDYINDYNNLSFEEKQLVDFIFSLTNLN
jgi:hypothetical protein